MVDAGLIEIFLSVEFLMGALMALAGEQGVKKAMALRNGAFMDDDEDQQQQPQQQHQQYYEEEQQEQRENEWAVEEPANESGSFSVRNESQYSVREEPKSVRSGEERRGPQEYDEYQAGPRR